MVARVSSVIAMAAIAASTHAAYVDPSVHRSLREQGSVNLMVTMKESNIRPLNAIQETEFTSRGAMIESLVNSLERHAQASHKSIDALLNRESTSTQPLFTSATSFWISNQKYIEGASPELVNSLLSNPDILEIRPELLLPLPKVRTTNSVASIDATTATQWGVTKILAPSAWAEGINGTGVVVGSIDTGVRGTHSALKSNFVGAYGWYDPEKKSSTAYDQHGHGTHTMGTIAGSNGIGVAPGAKWMACKGCRLYNCTESDLLECAQFMTCPTDTTGSNKDCSKAPRLVSNSWAGGQGDTFYKAAVDTWQKAGIIPIFANGNSGPYCGSVESPGDYSNVISVGATDRNDAIADYSSKGPSITGVLKPEISAPGSDVRSAWYTSDSAFNTISGTSMATPHVSGTVALLLSYKPKLTYSQVREALIAGADQTNLIGDDESCGNIPQTQFPNNAFGYGRLNALATLTKTD